MGEKQLGTFSKKTVVERVWRVAAEVGFRVAGCGFRVPGFRIYVPSVLCVFFVLAAFVFS